MYPPYGGYTYVSNKAKNAPINSFHFYLKKLDEKFGYVIRYLDICLNIKLTIMNRVFKALNDPIRREILELLKEKDMNAGEIADHFNITKPSISHHLDSLKQADLVISVKNGQFVNYTLNKTVVDEIIQWLMTINLKK